MKRLRLPLAMALAAALAMLTASPAQTLPTQYPGFRVIVSNEVVVGGEEATVTARTDPEFDCESWIFEYRGETETDGPGPTASATFDTREVDDVEVDPVTATCIVGHNDALGAGGVSSLGTSFVTEHQSVSGTGSITLLPEDEDGDDDGDDDGDGGDGDGDDGGLLPNTGGERLLWLLIGTLLVLVGGGVIVSSRRRDA